ncbi:hypothetical protein [Roseibium aggregatum]|uniref:Uncharacterized protein n=1 Tax=Roseibium aggregatum TaxID=187304 RepID=A0A939J5N0_9HYPH|nr:hypothetical protein [Roseibium aggregatum]MBN9672852.1 hypothetical protein [Roseibium aggregatum]
MQKSGTGGLDALSIGVWVLLTVLAALVFFWPDRTIAHVDDLFFIPWAASYAESGAHINPLLAVQFPGLEDYHLYTRFHPILSGLFLRLFGISTVSVVAYEFTCYFLTTLAFSALCLTLRLPKAALFAPVLFAPMYVVTGFRLEITACVLWMAGLFLLFASARLQEREGHGMRVSSLRSLAKLALAFAPLASPAVFAWSLGAILMHDAWRLWFRQADFRRLFLENAVALTVGLLAFSVSIDFDYAEFFRQFIYHSQRSTGGGVNGEALGRAVVFAGAALVSFRRAREVALLCALLAAGQALGAVLHDKVLVRNLAACVAFLTVVDVLARERFRGLAFALYGAVFLVVSANFLLFYVLSSEVGQRQAVVEDYRDDVSAQRRVFIDETMAHHYLDHQTGDALSWTWGREFPLARAEFLRELYPGDVWYVSPYTFFGYLKGHPRISRALAKVIPYERTPQLPCVMGRHSCRLPAERWAMLRLERDGDSVLVRDYANGREVTVPVRK